MMNATRLYFHYAAISIQSQLQYRTAFIMQIIGHFLITGIEFLGLWALFNRFGRLQAWILPEVALFYGIINIAFAIADALGRGFDVFSLFVKNGSFDRILLRPRTAVLQILGHELTLKRIGRLTQAIIITGWALYSLGITWNVGKVLLLTSTIVSGIALFLALFIFQATLSFWTIETLEIMNILTYGGVETTQYPISIYKKAFRKFFTMVVPLACVSYYPIITILGKHDTTGLPGLFGWFSPLAGFLFLGVSLVFWRFGVRHYTSTGS